MLNADKLYGSLPEAQISLLISLEFVWFTVINRKKVNEWTKADTTIGCDTAADWL